MLQYAHLFLHINQGKAEAQEFDPVVNGFELGSFIDHVFRSCYLSDVMKQRSHGQSVSGICRPYRIPRIHFGQFSSGLVEESQQKEGVLPHIPFGVIFRRLGNPAHFGHFRQQGLQHPRPLDKGVGNPRPVDDEKEPKEGLGLRNASERLRLLFGPAAKLELDLLDPARAVAKVRLPT